MLAIAKSRINTAYPDQWLANTYYNDGDEVSNLGQTFAATEPGTSGATGPTDDGGADGTSGLVWASTTATGSGAQFELAPGVYAATMPSFADTTVSPSQVATFTYSIAVLIVDQGS